MDARDIMGEESEEVAQQNVAGPSGLDAILQAQVILCLQCNALNRI